jgi:hypothetical protein
MKQILAILAVAVLCLSMLGCAPGTNGMVGTPRDGGDKPAGFWFGVWHGVISPVTFVISLFSRGTQVYEVHNNGGWYDFGFGLGISIIMGGGAGGTARRIRRRD